MKPQVSVVIPVYQEGEHIISCLERILREVTLPCEVLCVHDTPDDSTVPYVDKINREDERVRAVLNTYGRGPANAIRFGMDVAAAPVAVVTMADGSDDRARSTTWPASSTGAWWSPRRPGTWRAASRSAGRG